jgi:hydrogenase nickel incorporation protein HypA/HybF
MHELAVCQALIDQVQAIAIENGASRVAVVHVQLGPLSGVEPDLLRQAYPLACTGTSAEDSELKIVVIPVRVRCRVCGAESDATPNRLVCGRCSTWQTELISGDEMLLASIELERAEVTGPVH